MSGHLQGMQLELVEAMDSFSSLLGIARHQGSFRGTG